METVQVDQEQLQRLLDDSLEGIQEVDAAMLTAISQHLQGYNSFDPATLGDIQALFAAHYDGQERYYFGVEGSHVLYVATPQTMTDLLLDDDFKHNAAKASKSRRLWRGIDRLNASVDEIDYRPGKEWRYRSIVPGVFANWNPEHAPASDQDVFESDRIVFRFWWD